MKLDLCHRSRGITLSLMAGSTLCMGVLTACVPSSSQSSGSPTVLSDSTMARTGAVESVQFKTPDGWIIVGDRYMPSGVAKGAVVLLHQRGGGAQDWQALSTALQNAGFIALAIDQRGAGRSTQGPGPTGENAPWATSTDIATAIASLPKALPVGLVGASYGANNALIYAAQHPMKIKGLALFSPGANYNGLDAISAARKNRTPFVIYHGQDDAISGDGPQQINSISPAPNHRLQILSSSDHGTDLLNPKVISETSRFFESTLKP
jgi:dienelactone hydrolase